MLWKYGLPDDISRSGHINIIAEQIDEAEKNKASLYDKWGHVGLGLLILGFVLQAISNFL